MRLSLDYVEQNHWTERGRVVPVSDSDATDRRVGKFARSALKLP